MDGFEENDQIIVVAATNLASSLDPALSRPGRFDHKIEIKLPDTDARKEILKIHLKNKAHSVNDYQLVRSAEITKGFSGAELENVVNLAALQSVRKARILGREKSELLGEEFSAYITSFVETKKGPGRV